MKILAVEASSTACSVALCEENHLLGQNFLHSGFTHSKTLLPMVSELLLQTDTKLCEVDRIAVAVGPGSFTGLRIAIATVKGLAWGSDIPCIGCSTLGSMAWQLAHLEGYTILAVMDARRKQVYHSRFFVRNGVPERLCADGAISIEELREAVSNMTTPCILVGDGANLCKESMEHVPIAPLHLRIQQAYSVAQEGFRLEKLGQSSTAEELLAEYHRLSQAERERLAKQQG